MKTQCGLRAGLQFVRPGNGVDGCNRAVLFPARGVQDTAGRAPPAAGGAGATLTHVPLAWPRVRALGALPARRAGGPGARGAGGAGRAAPAPGPSCAHRSGPAEPGAARPPLGAVPLAAGRAALHAPAPSRLPIGRQPAALCMAPPPAPAGRRCAAVSGRRRSAGAAAGAGPAAALGRRSSGGRSRAQAAPPLRCRLAERAKPSGRRVTPRLLAALSPPRSP